MHLIVLGIAEKERAKEGSSHRSERSPIRILNAKRVRAESIVFVEKKNETSSNQMKKKRIQRKARVIIRDSR